VTSRSRRPRRRRPPSTEADQLARDWAAELAAAGLIQLTRAELELHLRGQVDRLLTTLADSPFLPHHARDVGAYLVDLQADQTETLRRTYLLLTRRLTDHATFTLDIGRDRVDRLLAELIAGWVDARHAATLTAQEELRRAADIARRDPDDDGDPPPISPSPWFH
jgi:hypothetical protein